MTARLQPNILAEERPGLVPAGRLICALCPLQMGRLRWAGALAMLAVLGWVSVAGVYDYQRGLQAVIEARNALLRSGVPRSSIDAGWSLDGNDLYRYPTAGTETKELEDGIPSVTSWVDLADYTIASAPISGTRVIRRIRYPNSSKQKRKKRCGYQWRQKCHTLWVNDGATSV